jgi:osmoprotectant transport system substrate-binding protein
MNGIARVSAALCAVAVLAGCAGSLGEASTSNPGSHVAGGGTRSVTVGSANFPENALLAEIYAGALRAAGVDSSTRLNIGSREVLLPTMEKGQVDVLPEYTGALLTYLSKGTATGRNTGEQLEALDAVLPAQLRLLKPSTAQDQETITCTSDVVHRYGLVSLVDLAKVSGDLTIGGPPELPQRDGFGLRGLKAGYGIEFKAFRPLDVAGPLTVSALASGKVDCANLFSTQSAITEHGFVSLTDPKGLAESDAVVPLVASAVATPRVTRALAAVSAVLTTENLKAMVKRVEVDKDDEATVAADFLAHHHLD